MRSHTHRSGGEEEQRDPLGLETSGHWPERSHAGSCSAVPAPVCGRPASLKSRPWGGTVISIATDCSFGILTPGESGAEGTRETTK